MKATHFHRFEVVAVLVLTVAVWGYDQSLGAVGSAAFDTRWGAVPARMWGAWRAMREGGLDRDVLMAALPLVTANFLHASFMHVAMNMAFFWLFGNALAEAVGRVLFPVIYLCAGIIAVLVHVRTNPTSEIPMVGASGAIAGLEGAYFVLVFRWEVPHPQIWPFEGPLQPWVLGVVALLNFFTDSQAFFGRVRDTTAYGAHVGGFVGGALLAMALTSLTRPRWRRRG